MPPKELLLQVTDLCVEFETRDGTAKVLDEVSLELRAGETLGIVGESGCGKSMTALSILRLIPSPPGKITAGRVRLSGTDLLSLDERRMRDIRGKDISMIFQEPMTSLNPVFTVGEQIAESLRLHEGISEKDAAKRAVEILKSVGIPEPEARAESYPHQLSGGMRQRVMIAIALACGPKVIIADEPTTALDVTVQAQIFDLLRDLNQHLQTAIILITHDMGAIAEMTDRVTVMYAGRVVEEGPVEAILEAPRHPYTQGLIACVPQLDPNPGSERPPLEEIPGVVPPLSRLGSGCAFAPRCKHAFARCHDERPERQPVGGDHSAACWLLVEDGTS
ncbi:ABC transporter ATP-binding protein [Denitrobaculum tricleocarpae]|uniref:ABC transporter ATP-binding protein n=2 Tax=Denitrobaculum tricleocarpae TaxID=2591009 RepID=A0A545TFC4_9PROT|nr:ABC transporter ATP-binding protein [Denitrobaculum tricleocarpae]